MITIELNFVPDLHIRSCSYVNDKNCIYMKDLGNDFVDLRFWGSEFHMCAPSDLKLLFPNFIVFREWTWRLLFTVS